jgi:hypothetical protein
MKTYFMMTLIYRSTNNQQFFIFLLTSFLFISCVDCNYIEKKRQQSFDGKFEIIIGFESCGGAAGSMTEDVFLASKGTPIEKSKLVFDGIHIDSTVANWLNNNTISVKCYFGKDGRIIDKREEVEIEDGKGEKILIKVIIEKK